MTLLVVSLIVLVCVLLILIVLIQNPKGGGLSSTFGGGGTQLFGGVKKTTDFLDRGTWILAIALVVLVLAANVMNQSNASTDIQDQESAVSQQLENGVPSPQGVQLPPANTATPGQNTDGGSQDLTPEPVSDN